MLKIAMSVFAMLKKIRKIGVRRGIRIIMNRLKNNQIEGFDCIRGYFANKKGLEVGGPSSMFMDYGCMPVYKLARELDGVNFSASTIWTGSIEENKGFVINGKNFGKIYIADATDLSKISNNVYDFILSCNNIEHIANPMKAMNEWILKLKQDGILVIVAPKKEANFDHRRRVVSFNHLLDDYNNGLDEHDLTHLDEILELHDLTIDAPAGTLEQFKERSLKNYENRCLHHHVFDLKVLEQMCGFFELRIVLMTENERDYIIVAKKM